MEQGVDRLRNLAMLLPHAFPWPVNHTAQHPAVPTAFCLVSKDIRPVEQAAGVQLFPWKDHFKLEWVEDQKH